MSIPFSQFTPSLLVFTHSFAMSVSLFLLCKLVHLYHFSRFHIYVLIYSISINTDCLVSLKNGYFSFSIFKSKYHNLFIILDVMNYWVTSKLTCGSFPFSS